MKDKIANNKDRRSDIKRRQFLYTAHIPEKRCGKDRRKKQKYQISKVNLNKWIQRWLCLFKI